MHMLPTALSNARALAHLRGERLAIHDVARAERARRRVAIEREADVRRLADARRGHVQLAVASAPFGDRTNKRKFMNSAVS